VATQFDNTFAIEDFSTTTQYAEAQKALIAVNEGDTAGVSAALAAESKAAHEADLNAASRILENRYIYYFGVMESTILPLDEEK
jgi:hypothetical protein